MSYRLTAYKALCQSMSLYKGNKFLEHLSHHINLLAVISIIKQLKKTTSFGPVRHQKESVFTTEQV